MGVSDKPCSASSAPTSRRYNKVFGPTRVLSDLDVPGQLPGLW